MTASSARGNPVGAPAQPVQQLIGGAAQPQMTAVVKFPQDGLGVRGAQPLSSRSWRCAAGSTLTSAAGVTRVVAITVTACACAQSTALSAGAVRDPGAQVQAQPIADGAVPPAAPAGHRPGLQRPGTAPPPAPGCRCRAASPPPWAASTTSRADQARQDLMMPSATRPASATLASSCCPRPAPTSSSWKSATIAGLADPAAPGHGHQPDPRVGHIPGQPARLDLPVLEPGRRHGRRRVDELRRPHRLRLGRQFLLLDPAADPPPRVGQVP